MPVNNDDRDKMELAPMLKVLLFRTLLSFERIAKRVSWFVNRRPIQIGAFSYGNPKVYMITDKNRLVIGKFCSIAPHVQILVDVNHPVDWGSTYPSVWGLGI
jgi:hypothetical protein